MQQDSKLNVRIRDLKQALNHGLILKKVHTVIQFNQKAWLKEYIDMSTELRKKAKNDFEKDFFKLMNNSIFGKTMQNVRKHRDIKLVTTSKRRNQLSYSKMVFPNPISSGNEMNKSKNEKAHLLRIYNIRFKQNCNV